MTPKRIQRRRTKGYRLPPEAVYVGRPTKYGNPIPWQGDWIMWAAVALGYRADAGGRRAASVALYRSWMTGQSVRRGDGSRNPWTIEYSSGATATSDEVISGLAALMVADRGPLPLPPPPDLEPLRGRDLVCWCPLCEAHADGLPLGVECADCPPCHADFLLVEANR